MDLTQFAGQYIKLRWRVETDANHDGGIGSGLHIDDFKLWIAEGYRYDIGVEDMQIPFPTSNSNEDVVIKVLLKNYGSTFQSGIPAFARMDSTNLIPLAPWSFLDPGQTITKIIHVGFDTISLGEHYWEAYSTFGYDENRMNDTLRAGYVQVTPASVYELGYDARRYTVPGGAYCYWQFAGGEGALCRFLPSDHSLPEGIDIREAKILFYSPGECAFHLFDSGAANQPGAEIFSADIQVSQTLPEWTSLDLSQLPQMANRQQSFWIWIESHGYDNAQITGDDAHFGQGHYFTFAGDSAEPLDSQEFYIRVMAEGNGQSSAEDAPEVQPRGCFSLRNHPNPFNSSTVISFQLSSPGFARLEIFNLKGERAAIVFEGNLRTGNHEFEFRGGDYSSGIYFCRITSRGGTEVRKMVLMK